MFAYATYAENVYIGELLLKKFYYYLVVDKLDNNKQIALLGDDFLECCKFTKEPHGSIAITEFDNDCYYEKRGSALSTDEILSITY